VPDCQPASCRTPQLCQLNRVRAGETVVVKQLNGSPETNQRLREMGFGEEQRVRVITLQANLLCQVCNSRLGLSSRLAELILVARPSLAGPGFRMAA
jgi:Fe2+ transport system protein FeoA